MAIGGLTMDVGLTFRMWHRIDKKMYYNIEDLDTDENPSLNSLLKNKHVHVMHSVGMFDVSNVLIYTGDIIKFTSGGISYQGLVGELTNGCINVFVDNETHFPLNKVSEVFVIGDCYVDRY